MSELQRDDALVFGETMWVTARPEVGVGTVHAVAMGERDTACGLSLDGLTVTEVALCDGAHGPKGRPCDECWATAE